MRAAVLKESVSLSENVNMAPSRPAQATLHAKWGGVSIHSTDPLTVAFFTNNDGNEVCADMAVKNLDTWVKCMHSCMSSNDSQRATSDVLAYLQAMEERQGLLTAGHAAQAGEQASGAVRLLQEKISEARDTLLSRSEVQHSQLQSSICAVSGQVQSHIMALITTVDHAVRSSVEKLDVGVISATVTQSVRAWLQSDVDTLKDGQTHAATAMRELEGRVRDVVVHMVADPQSTRHDHLIGMLGGLPAQVAAMCSKATVDACIGQDSETRANLSDKIGEMRVRLDEAMAAQSREVLETKTSVAVIAQRVQQTINKLCQMGTESGDRNIEQKEVVTLHMQHVPVVLKALLVEAFRELEAQSLHVKDAVHHSQQQLLKMERDMSDTFGSMKMLQKTSEDLSGRVHSMSEQLAVSLVKVPSINAKGSKAESRLHELLCGKLTARENYAITVVHGVSHACDMKIQRLGYPDVRVEVKAHGELTGVKVPVKEVIRFRSDLLSMNSHGIFVSLYSEIATKGKIDFEVLSNNKLAVYLSGNAYDVDIISDMVHFIYRLDQIVESSIATNSTQFKVTTEDMERVQLLLRDFGIKVQHTKTHLKEAISLLNELTFDRIEIVLKTSRALPTTAAPATDASAITRLPENASVAASPLSGFLCDSQDCPYSCNDRPRMVRHRKKFHNDSSRYRGSHTVTAGACGSIMG